MMTTDLPAAKAFLRDLTGERETAVLCAVSGGLDSMCLLHLLAFWGREHGLCVTAAHFNHQLRGAEACRDEAFVRDWCAGHHIPFVCGSGDTLALVRQKGLSVEEAARQLRYQFLEQQRQRWNCAWIFTAHHADDQAETMLLNLLRGTGLRGLAGIPAQRENIARPFLAVARTELLSYAAAHGILHVEDSTNQLDDAARNVLRHKVLPVLRDLNPRAVENMTRTAELLARDDAALRSQARQLLDQYARRVHDDRVELAVAPCLPLDTAVVSRVLLMLLEDFCGRRKDVSAAHGEALLRLLRTGRPGQSLSLPYGVSACRNETCLCLLRQTSPLPARVPIAPGQRVAFGLWEVALAQTAPPGAEAYPVCLPEGALFVSAWRSDDRLLLSGSRGSRTVKRLAAERGISPAERDQLPVLRLEAQPVAVPGLGVDVRFTPEGAAHLLVIFKKRMKEKDHEK